MFQFNYVEVWVETYIWYEMYDIYDMFPFDYATFISLSILYTNYPVKNVWITL